MRQAEKQPGEFDRPIDPSNALERVMRVDRKHSNFEFHDTMLNCHLRVAYPRAQQIHPGEHLLKYYWKHVTNFYFKNLDQTQFQRLQYIRKLLSHKGTEDFGFQAEKQFWQLLENTFNSTFINQVSGHQQKGIQFENFIKILYAYFKCIQNKSQKTTVKQAQQLKRLTMIKNNRASKLFSKNRKLKRKLDMNILKHEKNQLQYFIRAKTSANNQIDEELNMLQKQLSEIHQQNTRIFDNLEKRVLNQTNQRELMYIVNTQQETEQMDQQLEQQNNSLVKSSFKTLKSLNNVQTQLQYIKYAINQLQKKQIAQSISKVLKSQKSGRQYKFAVSFEKALNLKTRLMSEEQLLSLNKLRQCSIFKIYPMSTKSYFSINCQNLAGFRHIQKHHDQPCKYFGKEDNHLIELAKKMIYDPSDPSVKTFEQFDVCHHCKQFYHNDFLDKCKYNSSRSGNPLIPSSYFNPYLMQANKFQGTTASNHQRFSMRKKNIMFGYSKKDDQYCCNRKFCKYCLKNTYSQSFDKNGHCPFCQGICFCSRCARTQMITKLKSIYHLLGGNIAQLSKESLLEKIQQLQQDQQISIRKKGRPKKSVTLDSKPHTHIFKYKSLNKMNEIREQLQDTRILCDLVKRRQKKKQKVQEGQNRIFTNKVPLISKDYSCKRSFKQVYMQQNDDPEVIRMRRIRKMLRTY